MGTTGLNIEFVHREEELVLLVDGELDLATSPALDEALTRAETKDAARIVVDLGRVGFIDSTALGVLARHAALSSQDSQRLRIANLSAQAQRLFEITGMLQHLPLLIDQT